MNCESSCCVLCSLDLFLDFTMLSFDRFVDLIFSDLKGGLMFVM